MSVFQQIQTPAPALANVPSPASAHLLVERIEKLERKVENAETEIQFLRNMVLALEGRINGATIAFNGPSKTGSRF